MATLLALLPAPGHDQLWFLLMARRWLAGAQLYGPQAFDSNPPGIVWLSTLPIFLGNALHIAAPIAGKLLVLLAETAASLLSLYFLRRARPNRPLYETPALAFTAITLFCIVPARDLGQRDQILSFLILPYILAAALNPRLHRLPVARCAAALIAALGICLKPHHALIVLAVELALLLAPSFFFPQHNQVPQDFSLGSDSLEEERTLAPGRWTRILRLEPFILIFSGLAFLLAVHRLTPLYFTQTLPILRDTYWAIGNLSLPNLLWQAIELVLLAAISLTLFAKIKPRSPQIALLLIAGTAATAAYLIQGTGWYYQQLPAITLFAAALTLQLLNILATRTPPRRLIPAIAALSVLALLLTAHFTGYPFTPNRIYAPIFADDTMPDPTLFTPNTSVAILTTSVEAAMMPVERYNLTWAQRTNNLWLLPAILRSESPTTPTHHTIPPARLAELEALQHRWLLEDLNRWHPTLILIARCQDPNALCQELEDRHDDLLAWFQRDPAFTTLLTHYTHTTRNHFDAYTLTR